MAARAGLGHGHWEGLLVCRGITGSLTSSLMTTRLHGICSDLTVDSRDPESLSPLPCQADCGPGSTPACERQQGALEAPPSGDGGGKPGPLCPGLMVPPASIWPTPPK